MGRAPCCDKQGLRKGPWSPEEDKILVDFIQNNGLGSWRSLPKQAGLLRCGKSCRLRWTNYLRPDIKRGPFTPEEQKSIAQLHGIVGNKWSTIASQLPGRTDNEIKNYWNTHLRKRIVRLGINPETYAPSSSPSSVASDGCGGVAPPSTAAGSSSSATRHMAQWESARLEAEARHSRESVLFSTSGASAAAPAASSADCDHSAVAKTNDADFFLRIWNSDVGESFRSKEATSACRVSPASSTMCSSSTRIAVKKEEGRKGGGAGVSSVSSGDGEPKEEVDCKSSVSGCRGGGNNAVATGCDGAAVDSSSSNEMDPSEETYQMYLNLVGDDMTLSHLFQGSLDNISLFGSDIQGDPSLDIDFK